ncbi:uncharacterized protein LOC143026454 [Oratosquilla oratoria]|uniref:uncharacterized protein LOC143026454 n=1 Tax=Oratosquilla oratoria TaxID=337810 RepID=UPI003F76AC9A
MQRLLFKAGFPFHQSSVLKSELRVLEELKFKCSMGSSPLVYVGVLLALASSYPEGSPQAKDGSGRSKGPSKIKGNSRRRGRKTEETAREEDKEEEEEEDSGPPMYYVGGNEKVRLDKLYKTTTLVLEAAHLKHGAIYRRVFKRVTGSEVMSRRYRRGFVKVVADRLLLSGSSVVAAAWLFGDSMGDSMAKSIAHHTRIPVDDLQVFAACILHEILGSSLLNT